MIDNIDNKTLAQIKQAHHQAQSQTDQETAMLTEGEERADTEASREAQTSLFVSTEPLHPKTFHRTGEGGFAIGEYAVIKIEPTTDPGLFRCSTMQPDGTSQEHSVEAKNILLAALGSEEVPMEREADWFSKYLHARGLLKMFATVVAETTVGTALRYAWGSESFLEALTRANEVLPLFPTEFADTASLFASSLSLENVLARLAQDSTPDNLTPFVQRVLGGQAFLEAFTQLQKARSFLPALFQNQDVLPSVSTHIIQGTTAIPRAHVSVIDKRDEAEPLRTEIVEQGKNTLQLYIALVFGATSFLAILIQPNVPPLTACLLPLAVLSIAIKMAAHDLRPGQINFYQRRIIHSPYEIVRRIIFDGSQPSEQELQILKEQGIEITQALLAEARTLQPFFPDMHSKAHRIAILIFDGAAFGVILLHAINALTQHDTATLIQAIIALFISIGLTIPSFIVLRRKRVR